ncbi:MBL fold metallo-hydrolase [Rhodovulum sp. 12E13]|uniref:MBL fold metallo-hydrolase n=1 Tax=Rhodovulum sp. 12E13 TaxID=2203891 RepID=UPI001F33FCB6|nr:MBL fold metallo-hydrolase [Rhodovulum sp. 12E13]
MEVEPGLRLVRAPNPSPMTHTGTNTWIVGQGEVAVIDPGPDLPAHLAAIEAALGAGERIGHVLVTHAHRDHSPLARPLAARWGAPVLAAGGMAARRRPVMARLAAEAGIGGGEGVDAGFAPDVVLEDGAEIAGEDWRLDVIATPGHTADHLAFAWGEAVFTGDHVMGWASSLVSPPEGDVVPFMASCRRLAARPSRVFYPGHGEPVDDPAGRLAWLVAHREAREAAIVAALGEGGPATPGALAARIYTDTPPALLPAAERNVLAHLIALVEAGRATASPAVSSRAHYTLA